MKILYLFILLSVISTLNIFACDCDGEEISIEEGLKKSEKVFLGTVVSFKNTSTKYDGMEYIITEFKVQENFKGTQTSKVVSVASEPSNCGGTFQKGQTYLIFTFKNEDFSETEYHQCFKLALLEDNADENLNRLRTINED